jgi:peptidyl-prolyl cis-trans isomerase SurA
MAGRMHISVAQFTEVLAHSGVKPPTLKEKLRAQIVWTQLVKGRYQSTLQVGEQEILSAIDQKDTKGAVGYEYTLRPILFIVDHGAAEGSFEARKREAESLRARFENCDEGVRVARLIKDVAVRTTIIRNSADLAEQLRPVLEGTAIGHLTPPEVTKEGVQVFAVCGKKQTNSDTPEKRAAKEKIFTTRYEQQAKRYMDEIRKGAMIEYR